MAKKVEPPPAAPSSGAILALGPLLEVPAAIGSAAAVIAQLDQCLRAGFGRLSAEQATGLANLGAVFSGTPLEGPLSKALGALKGNEFQPQHFVVLAAARSALQGARYDALLGQVNAVLGRTSPNSLSPIGGEGRGEGANVGKQQTPNTQLSTLNTQRSTSDPGGGEGGNRAVLCESAQHWLMELAITGFQQVDAATLAPFSATLENLQADPALGRLATLLTGFQQELLAALPIGHASVIPIYRWADLWMRAMVSSLQAQRGESNLPAAIGKVAGTLSVLGVDLRQSDCVVSAVVYALLEVEGQPPRIVRITLTSFKVDALQGREVWRCLAGGAQSNNHTLPLLKAISQPAPLKITGMTLLATGDLLWDGEAAEAGKPYDVFAFAERCLAEKTPVVFPLVPPADRHPVQLAELVYLAPVEAKKQESGLAANLGSGATLAVAEDRLPSGEELTREDLLACDTMIGLLRFDEGHWLVQPLAVRPGAAKEKKAVAQAAVGGSAYEMVTKKPKKGEPNTLSVLQERASRLLRKKS